MRLSVHLVLINLPRPHTHTLSSSLPSFFQFPPRPSGKHGIKGEEEEGEGEEAEGEKRK